MLLVVLWVYNSGEDGETATTLASEEKRNGTVKNTTVESIESIVLPEKGAAEKEHSSSLGAGLRLGAHHLEKLHFLTVCRPCFSL